MNIPINLASEKLRHDRPVVAVCAILAALLGLLLIVLTASIVRGRSAAASARAEIARLDTESKRVAAEQAGFDATLRKPENSAVLERSLMLNGLIERKSISWTRIFADLEKVTPGNVRLIYIRLPQVNRDNQVVLDMVVGAQSVEPLQEFLKRLEGSPVFGAPGVSNFMPPSQNDPLYRYRVNVNYAQRL